MRSALPQITQTRVYHYNRQQTAVATRRARSKVTGGRPSGRRPKRALTASNVAFWCNDVTRFDSIYGSYYRSQPYVACQTLVDSDTLTNLSRWASTRFRKLSGRATQLPYVDNMTIDNYSQMTSSPSYVQQLCKLNASFRGHGGTKHRSG